jgi:ABC-type glycerol-3-phosphate transport system permease component
MRDRDGSVGHDRRIRAIASDRRARRRVRSVLGSLGLVLGSGLLLFPLYVALTSALAPLARTLDYPSALLPRDVRLDNFREALRGGDLERSLVNSVLVAGVVTVGQVATGALAGFAFAAFEFRGRQLMFAVFVATLMVPTEVTIIGNHDTMERLRWLDSYQALTVPFLATGFGTFLYRQAFRSIPGDLREAAALDGWGPLGYFRHVALPMARPVTATMSLLAFVTTWNQYLWPLLVTDDPRHRTVQVALRSLSAGNVDDINVVMAATVMAVAPVLVLTLALHRRLLRGFRFVGM